MSKRLPGRLVVIGGHEQKDPDQDRVILKAVAAAATERKGHLVVVTAATEEPEAMARDYRDAFGSLGVKHLDILDVRDRHDAFDEERVAKVADASVVFFTGGDQMLITSKLGDTPVFRCIWERFQAGAMIAGTSAGAAAMPETMIVSGPGDESNRPSALGMAPGLGLLEGVVIDSHFAERGRMGRLIGAVAQNPRNVGIGIDEDTAIVVEPDGVFRVLGSGAVYAVDGSGVTYSSLNERSADRILSVFDVCLHVLGEGDRFDLHHRRPSSPTGTESH